METNMNNDDLEMEIALTEILKKSDEFEEENNTVYIPKKERLSLVFVFLCLFGMIFLSCILMNLNYGEEFNGIIIWKLLITTGLMVLSGVLTNIICLVEHEKYTLEGFLTFAFVILEFMWLDEFFFSNSLTYYIISTKWKWGYEVLILFGNALFLQKLSQIMTEKNSVKNELGGLFAFVIWNAFQIYLSSNLSIAYHESLVITNYCMFGGVLFSLEKKNKNMRKKVMMFLSYGFVLVFLLFIRKPEWFTIGNYLLGEEGFSGYTETVRRLLSSSRFLGPAYEGYAKDVVILLHKDLAPLKSILVYYGILPGVLFIFIYSITLTILWRLLISTKKRPFLFSLGIAGYCHIIMRFITGILYELGVSPMKIALPFIGENSVIDYCCVSVILVIWFKGKKDTQNRKKFGRLCYANF